MPFKELWELWSWLYGPLHTVWSWLFPVLREAWGWFLLFLRWEGAVINWKHDGRSEQFVFFAALGGVILELAFILAMFEGGLRGVRLFRVWLRSHGLLPKKLGRIKLNGKGDRIPAWVRGILRWMQERQVGKFVRDCLVGLLAVCPFAPYAAYGAIFISRATRTGRSRYLIVVIATVAKVFITVRIVFHFHFF